jgi:23S rRNA (pseudouridine1915-N3)-methyltransferase
MKIQICAIGRMRDIPEAKLANNYLERFNRIGSNFGLGPVKTLETEDKKSGGPTSEGRLLKNLIPTGSLTCTLDEKGHEMTSIDFANRLAEWRDQGKPSISLIIGGASGLSEDLKNEANCSISFGKFVWPHLLIRVMLAEQLYRAATILSGSPYHRI